MPIRASGVIPLATIRSDATAAASLKTAAAENARCHSCSDGIAGLQDGLCLCRLVEKDLERRNIGVPLDQRRLGTEACDGGAVERPYRKGDPRSVRIDEAVPTSVEPGQVNLAYRVPRNCRQISVRIEPVIDRVDVDIVDIEEELAAGTEGKGGNKIPFAHRVVSEANIGGDILDQERASERALHGVDAIANERQRFFGERQRQEIIEVAAVDVTPAKVLRYRARLDPGDEMLQPCEVPHIERIGGSQRQSD